MAMAARAAACGVVCATLGVGATAKAQDWAKATLDKSPRHSEYVVIPEASGRKLQAFVVYPEVKDKAPVVVLIHEIFGESDWFKEMADELAGAGYIVIAPDLLSGYGPAPAQAGATMDTPGASKEDHTHMSMPGSGGVAFVQMSPGGTSAFPDQQAVVKGVTSLPDAEVMDDLDAASDYGEAVCGGLLLGWRKELSVCDASQGPERGVCVLWTSAASGGDGEHYGSGVWVLCRERRSNYGDGAEDGDRYEGRRQDV
jgi:hypothetical protein